jgi:serine/threonine protein kinase
VSLVEGDVVVRAEARVGTLLRGKYRLGRVLGVGGMAAVYEATHRNSKRFAVKVLHPELSLQTDVRVRFLREGYAATQVNHPGAVAVLDDDVSEDGSAFLVMELLEGASVDALWERSRWKMPAGAVLAIAYQLLDILAAAHQNGIVHRDIKPDNLFVTHEGQVKVLDFGIARLKDTAQASVTGTGFVMGTPSFMAPEQAQGRSKEIDAQSDLWATGAVLFTLLSGQFVHEGESPQAIVVQCATEPARSLREVLPGAPTEIVQLVDSALAFKKTARWATAVAMRKGVEAAAYAVLGTGASRGVLLELLSKFPAGDPADDRSDVSQTIAHKRPSAIRSEPPPDVTPTRVRASEAGQASAATVAEVVVDPPRRVGLTTEQPVAGDSAITPGWLSRRTAPWIAAGGALALILLGAIVAGSRRGPGPAAALTGEPSIQAPANAPVLPPAIATVQQPPVPAPSTIAVDALPSVSAANPAAPPAPPAAVAPRPAAAAPHAAPPPPPAAAPAPAPPAPAQTPAQSTTNCTPPFTVDPATGKKKWKAECL